MNKRKKNDLSVASSSEAAVNEVGEVSDDQAVDYFSCLPDCVIAKILSLLTMKEALRTCILSRKLWHVSTMIPDIELIENGDVNSKSVDRKKKEVVQSFTRFLARHDGLIRSFRLSFHLGKYKNDVLRWISMAVKNGMEELDLTFDPYSPLEIPVSYLAAETVKVLKLRCCRFDLPSAISGFKLLESLLLGSMYISDDMLASLLCYCESLKDLTLQKCWGFQEIGITDPKLESLTLDDCLNSTKLNAPNLKTLVIRDQRMDFSIVEVTNVENVLLFRDVNQEINPQEGENLKTNVVNRMLNLKSLHLSGWAFKCFAAAHAMRNYQWPNLGILKLELKMSLWNLKELYDLLKHAKDVTKLVISINNDTSRSDYRSITDQKFDSLSDEYWENQYESQPAPGCEISSVQWIEINGFRGRILEVSFVKFMVANSRQLKTVLVTPVRGMESNRCFKLAKLFSRLPKLSEDAKIILSVLPK